MRILASMRSPIWVDHPESESPGHWIDSGSDHGAAYAGLARGYSHDIRPKLGGGPLGPGTVQPSCSPPTPSLATTADGITLAVELRGRGKCPRRGAPAEVTHRYRGSDQDHFRDAQHDEGLGHPESGAEEITQQRV